MVRQFPIKVTMLNFTYIMQGLLPLLVSVFVPIQVLSQTVKKDVVGNVKDQSGNGLTGVNIQLIAQGQLTDTWWAASDSVGNFEFAALSQGRYLLNASLIGFKPVSDTILIQGSTSKKLTYNMVMKEAASELKAVTVTSRKEAIEIDKGKLVYNVGNSATSAGSSALELLRKLPGVSIGQDDQIMLKGAGGINVMIDGKMTYLSEQQLVQLLRSMSGESIAKIELISAPGAEFDAAGNAGIINFVTKKNVFVGYSLDILSGISKGRFWMNNQNVAASYRNSKVNVSGTFDYNTPHRFMQSQTSNTVLDQGQRITLDRRLQTPTKINFYTYKVNLDWHLSPKHQLTAGYNGYLDDYVKDNAISRVSRLDPQNKLIGVVESTNYLTEPYHYDAANLGYQFLIDSAGKKLTADAHYISYRNLSDGLLTTRYLDAEGQTAAPNEQLQVHQPGTVSIKSIKADLDLPFTSFHVKAGLKYADVRNQANYRFDSLSAGEFIEAESMSNRFRYTEQIAAVYASVAGKLDRTQWEVGLRFESTNARGYTVEEEIDNSWKYSQLFPSLSAQHEINKNNKVNFSVSRRINRPAYSTLNPVRWYYDQYFYYSGNPYLRPEMAWIYSAGYTLKDRYVLAASYSTRSNYLSRRLGIEENTGAIISQSANLGSMRRFDLTASVPLHLLDFWDLQLTAGASHTSYPIPLLESEKITALWAASAMLSQQFKLPAGFHAELSATWTSRELWGIYEKESIFFTDFGLKKSFMKGKLDVRFSFTDFLRTNRYRGRSLTDYTDYRYDDLPDTRRASLSVKYHFGGQIQAGRPRRIEEQDRL